MDDLVQMKLIELIRQISGTKKSITESTSINYDLPLDGSDAAELVDAIWIEFKTSFDGFRFEKYFNDEGPLAIFSFSKRKKDRLSFQHVVNVVKRGCWFEPELTEP